MRPEIRALLSRNLQTIIKRQRSDVNAIRQRLATATLMPMNTEIREFAQEHGIELRKRQPHQMGGKKKGPARRPAPERMGPKLNKRQGTT